MQRVQLLDELAHRIAHIERPHPIRVAIDGVDAAGKTRLAEDLVTPLRACGRSVIRASLDGFHYPAHMRYQRGSASPEGYYRDSFNYPALIESLLAPLGPGGSCWYRAAVFDFRTSADVTKRYEQRYIRGQRLYLEECRPKERATVVVENNDSWHPVLYAGKGHVSHNGP